VPSFPEVLPTQPYPILPPNPLAPGPRIPRIGPAPNERPSIPPIEEPAPRVPGSGPATPAMPKVMKDIAERLFEQTAPVTQPGLQLPFIPPAPDIPWWAR
jgi:hypothetical protein